MIKINKEIEILKQNPNKNLTPQEFSKWNFKNKEEEERNIIESHKTTLEFQNKFQEFEMGIRNEPSQGKTTNRK